MQTKPKSNSVVTHKVEGGVLVFSVKDAGELRFDPKKAAAACRERAELHGWIQRVSDAAALPRDTKTGKPATPVAKFEAMRRLVMYYETGVAEWRMAGGGGGAGGAGVEKGLLVRALREIYPSRSEEQLAEWVGKRSAQERAALMASERIKGLVEKFRAEQGSGVDADELLSGLEEPETAEESSADLRPFSGSYTAE